MKNSESPTNELQNSSPAKRPRSESPGDSESLDSKETVIQRHIGKITGEIVATTLGQGAIFEKIHARAGTNVSGGEGDHITASAVLNEIIYNFLEDKNYDQTISELPVLLSSLGIKEDYEGKIKEILESRKDFLNQNHLTLSKERRYDLTQDLRQTRLIAEELKEKDLGSLAKSLGLSEENQRRFKELFTPDKVFKEEEIVEVRESLKYSRRAANAATIATISEEMVYILNHQKDPPSALPARRNPSGCHSRDENESMKNLRMFNALCGLTYEFKSAGIMDGDKIPLLDEFREDIKAIMRYSNPNISKAETINSNFGQFMKDFFGADQEFVSKKIGEIDTKWVSDIVQSLKTNTNYTAKLGECFNNLYDFGYVEHKDPDEIAKDEQTLYKSTARHISYLFNAFGKLRFLSLEKSKEIKEKFFDEILVKSSYTDEQGKKRVWDSKGQGWQDREIDISGTKLDKEHLKENVTKYLDKDHNFSREPLATTSRTVI